MSKASMIGDVVKVVADAFTSTPKPKPKGKGGRKRKPRGPKAATPQQKAAARALGININTAKALSPADLDKAIKSRPNKAKAPVSKRTPKEERTLAALIKRQKKDDSDFGGEEPDRLKLSAGGSEVLPSKAQLDPEIRNYSKKRLVSFPRLPVRLPEIWGEKLIQIKKLAVLKEVRNSMKVLEILSILWKHCLMNERRAVRFFIKDLAVL